MEETIVVRCVDGGKPYLTEGKVYQAKRDGPFYYLVEDDRGVVYSFLTTRFEPAEELGVTDGGGVVFHRYVNPQVEALKIQVELMSQALKSSNALLESLVGGVSQGEAEYVWTQILVNKRALCGETVFSVTNEEGSTPKVQEASNG